MNKILIAALLVLAFSAVPGFAQTLPGTTKKDQSKLDEIRRRMVEIDNKIEIVELRKNEEPARRAQLVRQPVLRYTDEPIRIFDASLWVWTAHGRSVAVQKLEAYSPRPGTALWTTCLCSLTPGRITTTWPTKRNGEARTFASTKAGIDFKPIPLTDVPGESKTARKLAVRRIARRFKAVAFNSPGKESPMRLMPSPVFEYIASGDKPCGAVFALTRSTNPDLLLSLELRPTKEGPRSWHYGVSRMLVRAARVQFNDETLVQLPAVPVNNTNVFDAWTFFYDKRTALTERESESQLK